MRNSISDLEKLLTTLHVEVNNDRVFLSSLLDHKNATIGWFRDRQNNDLTLLEEMYEKIQVNQQEHMKALNKLYDDMSDTLAKEVLLIENHLRSYEQGTPDYEDRSHE